MFNKFRYDKLVHFRFLMREANLFPFFTDKLSNFSKVRESVWTSGFQLATKQILRKQISMDTVGLQLVITFLKVEIRTKTSHKAAKFPRPEYQFQISSLKTNMPETTIPKRYHQPFRFDKPSRDLQFSTFETENFLKRI